MNMKKWLCLAIAMLLALGVAAYAEGDGAEDLQAQLDAANARIAELEDEVERYRPFYEAQIVAEYGDNGIIWLADAQARYDEIASMYASYGIPVDSYAAEIKQSLLSSMVQDAILADKAAELGISDLDEDTRADLTEEAEADLETYINYYASYFTEEGMTDEEIREATIAGLADAGITVDALLQDRVDEYVSEQLHTYLTQDVAVNDDDIQAEYESMVASDQERFEGSDYDYNSARSSGETIAWNPEGYRAVKHVLVLFSDAQSSQYSELQSALSSLNDELAALDAAENGEAEEPADAPAEGEAEETPRTREEIEADIGSVGVAIEALYSELLPRAQEVIDAFEAGTDIDTLIAEYGEDPGMTREPTSAIGYAVSADSTYWDPAFRDGAMSIAEPGQISEPVYGSNGIHIIYYAADITPGAVPFEEIADGVEAEALESKISQTYNDQVDAWIEEANVVYHLDRF